LFLAFPGVIAFAREDADVAINHLLEEEGLSITRIPKDVLSETYCTSLVHEASGALGGLDSIMLGMSLGTRKTGANLLFG
jgi:hypothetical protein